MSIIPPESLSSFQLFDAHLHIIDPRFPLVPNQGYLPEPFTCDDYLARLQSYRLAGGAVVSGSFQAFDQTYLRAALASLGPGFVGVTQLPTSVSDEEVLDLDRCGVRAVRFNLRRGGSEDIRHLRNLALRVHDLAGWHVELYVDSRDLPDLLPLILQLPAASIDHLGLSAAGLDTLLRLVEHGVQVKATGFGRADFPVAAALKQICAVNPGALMFGTDLPSTRAPRPYADEDFLLIPETLGEAFATRVLYTNARNFYSATPR